MRILLLIIVPPPLNNNEIFLNYILRTPFAQHVFQKESGSYSVALFDDVLGTIVLHGLFLNLLLPTFTFRTMVDTPVAMVGTDQFHQPKYEVSFSLRLLAAFVVLFQVLRIVLLGGQQDRSVYPGRATVVEKNELVRFAIVCLQQIVGLHRDYLQVVVPQSLVVVGRDFVPDDLPEHRIVQGVRYRVSELAGDLFRRKRYSGFEDSILPSNEFRMRRTCGGSADNK